MEFGDGEKIVPKEVIANKKIMKSLIFIK